MMVIVVNGRLQLSQMRLSAQLAWVEYDRLLIPKQKKEGQPAQITLNPYSNFLESTVYYATRDLGEECLHLPWGLAADRGSSGQWDFPDISGFPFEGAF